METDDMPLMQAYNILYNNSLHSQSLNSHQSYIETILSYHLTLTGHHTELRPNPSELMKSFQILCAGQRVAENLGSTKFTEVDDQGRQSD